MATAVQADRRAALQEHADPLQDRVHVRAARVASTVGAQQAIAAERQAGRVEDHSTGVLQVTRHVRVEWRAVQVVARWVVLAVQARTVEQWAEAQRALALPAPAVAAVAMLPVVADTHLVADMLPAADTHPAVVADTTANNSARS